MVRPRFHAAPAAVMEVDSGNIIQRAATCPIYSGADLLGVAPQLLQRSSLNTWLEASPAGCYCVHWACC